MADKTAIADGIYNTIESSVQKVHIVDGLDVKSARAVLDIADTVLNEVEGLSQDDLNSLTNDDRKDIVIDVISRLITLDIKWVPNFIEEKAKRYVVSSIVEFTLAFIDKKFGKSW